MTDVKGEILAHSNLITNRVHDELIRWTGQLLKDAGLEAVDVWGRFPPEGTVRSHLVLFPYRVGPEPKMMETSRGATIMTLAEYPSDKFGTVPTAWRDLGKALARSVPRFFPETGHLDTTRRRSQNVAPFPEIDELPKPLADWYRDQDPSEDDPFTLKADAGPLYCRPPSLSWKQGVEVWSHYIAVAGDAGRGVSDRTSDAPPLSLGALSVLTVGIQLDKVVHVELPPMPFDNRIREFGLALIKSLRARESEEEGPTNDELADELEDCLERISATGKYSFGVTPVHDLSMHEFALLTQALQRPLQAVLNFQIKFRLGATPDFRPTTVVHVALPKNRGRKR